MALGNSIHGHQCRRILHNDIPLFGEKVELLRPKLLKPQMKSFYRHRTSIQLESIIFALNRELHWHKLYARPRYWKKHINIRYIKYANKYPLKEKQKHDSHQHQIVPTRDLWTLHGWTVHKDNIISGQTSGTQHIQNNSIWKAIKQNTS